jgi:fumarate reductase subunit C
MKTKEYIRPMPATWWLHNRHLFLFMLRELTSVFIVGYGIFLLAILYNVNRSLPTDPGLSQEEVISTGVRNFQPFYQKVLCSPLSVVLHLVTFLAVVYHSITSFNAAPVIMTVWKGDEKVDPRLVIGANYALWAALSLIILMIAVSYHPEL